MALGVVVMDVEGLTLSAEDERLLAHPQVGGLILFKRNFESIRQLRDLVLAVRQCRPDIVIAVDHEGGRVQRFRTEFSTIPAMQSFLMDFRVDPDATIAEVQDYGWLMASELLACDIDISFAPVLDVDDHKCAVIADRAFSPHPEEVVVLAAAFIRGMHEAGMAVTGKHFPGHGSVSGDSHLLQPVDSRSLPEIEALDLIPFVKLSNQLDAVMPAHIVFPAVDSQPVGFSRIWLKDKLRTEMGFQGVIFSDDLSMVGAHSVGDFNQRADAALAAGCDMVLVCNNRQAVLQIISHLTDTGQPASTRIGRMRMRNRVHWMDLHQDPRWQRLVVGLPQDLTI